MNKILTIIQREYWVRVRSKAFILTTLLTPFGLGLVMLIPILTAVNVEKTHTVVYVHDESGGAIAANLLQKSNEEFDFQPAEGGKEFYTDKLGPGEVLLVVPSDIIKKGNTNNSNLFYADRITLQVKEGVRRKLNDAYLHAQLEKLNIKEDQYDDIRKRLTVTDQSIVPEAKETTSTEVAAAVGYVMGFLIYIMLIMYGMYVMRGVIEEKSNRILEVMVSSVRPFQLMMGKILGIGLVAVTQYIIWIALSIGVIFSIGLFFQPDPAAVQSAQEMNDPEQIEEMAATIQQVLDAINFQSVSLFLFYFVGGFLLFGSLFAAVGSTVDQETDAQQFTFLIMIPIIIPMLVLGNVIQNPAGTLAVFFSIFPLFSPTIMMVRQAATDVPWYETLTSMTLLVLGFLGAVWLAARVYRIGILMYGKKVTLKEIIKWVRHY